MYLGGTYVDRPVALLHVVGSEDVADLGQLVQKVVLETEHGCRAHDCGFGVDVADDLLTPRLSKCQSSIHANLQSTD